MSKPKKWTEVYPQGTKEGDEECKFFIALARNKKWEWRSTSALVKESGLSKSRVEEIIAKYIGTGIIVTKSSMEDHWGYWERVPEKFLKKDDGNISKKDQKKRVDKHISGQDKVDSSGSKDDDIKVTSKIFGWSRISCWSWKEDLDDNNLDQEISWEKSIEPFDFSAGLDDNIKITAVE